MHRLLASLLLLGSCLCPAQQQSETAQQQPDQPPASSPVPIRSDFRVKYVTGTDAYIDGGRDSGLAEGTALVLKQAPSDREASRDETALEPGILAKRTVVSIASSSAVCHVDSSTRDLAVGDTVALPQAEIEHLIEKNALGDRRKYP